MIPSLSIHDTYPNPERVRTLILYRQPSSGSALSDDTIVHLGNLRRFDFHPRWHSNGERICVDSAHLGRRQLCILDVKGQVTNSLVTPS